MKMEWSGTIASNAAEQADLFATVFETRLWNIVFDTSDKERPVIRFTQNLQAEADAELGALLRKLPANVDLCHQESGKWVVFDLRQPLPNGIGKCADTPDEVLQMALDAEAVPPAIDAEQPKPDGCYKDAP